MLDGVCVVEKVRVGGGKINQQRCLAESEGWPSNKVLDPLG